MDNQENKLCFFITANTPCNYLEERQANSLFADPLFPRDKALYSALVENGFRRSGEHIYKPYCQQCSECIPVRIPVTDFNYSRNQKRTWKKNQDLSIQRLDAEFKQEHFELYQKYLVSRHKDGGMDNPSEENYKHFLWTPWSETALIEFRLDNTLIAIAVIDQLKHAYSAVYTFFDPEFSNRSLGRFAVLYLIEETKKQGFPWLYLGYWIASCNKMSYKIEYQPMECFIGEEWKTFSTLELDPNT